MPQPSPILPPPDGPASVPPPRRAGPALYTLVAVALFALMDTGLKILSPHYPALQVATPRAAAAPPPALAGSLATLGARGLDRQSGVKGKSGSVRVSVRGTPSINKKK